ncbi:Thyroid adenoma-associated protein-like protein [Trichoplax sp. H2]|nr:Thyroid adenoma-associated protein-like protein [Trichoplax sp. H2]|eukprot:RDD43254.1 Thyroid adenoma-associated protein-like protein [Trichoplax sp. H2]
MKLTLQQRLVQQLSAHIESDQYLALIEPILECATTEETLLQLNLVRKLGNLLKSFTANASWEEEQLQSCLLALAQLHSQTPCRTPLQRSFTSAFQKVPSLFETAVLISLENILQKDIANGKTLLLHRKVTVDDISRYLEKIMSLLENFKLGQKCLEKNSLLVVEFLTTCLGSCMKPTESWSTQEPYFDKDCFSIIKVVIAVLHKIGLKLGQVVSNENFSLVNDQHEWLTLYKTLLTYSNSIFCCDCYLHDSRTSAGMAIFLVLKLIYNQDSLVMKVRDILFRNRFKNTDLLSEELPKVQSHEDHNDEAASLYLYHGLLAMLNIDDIVKAEEKYNQKSIMGGIIARLIEISYWSIMGRGDNLNWKEVLRSDGKIIQNLLGRIWDNWDHPVEGVRHQMKQLFCSILDIHTTMLVSDIKEDTFLLQLTHSVLEQNWFRRGKYDILSSLLNYLPASKLLLLQPSLLSDVVQAMIDASITSHAGTFLDKLLTSWKSEYKSTHLPIYLTKLHTIWLEPIMSLLQSNDTNIKRVIIDQAIPRLINKVPESLQSVLLIFNQQIDTSPDSYMYRGLIKTLNVARMSETASKRRTEEVLHGDANYDNALWKDLIDIGIIWKALHHSDSQIRLDTFVLLCESRKTCEEIQATDLELILTFVTHNFEADSTSFRQRFIASSKKLIVRLKESARTMIMQQLSSKNDNIKSQLERKLNHYKVFLNWLWKFCITSLYPTASIIRRSTAIALLQIIVEILNTKDIGRDCKTFNPLIITLEETEILLDSLTDTYEIVKQAAYKILMTLPVDDLGLTDQRRIQALSNKIINLAKSFKPANHTAAGYLLLLLLNRYSTKCKFNLALEYYDHTDSVREEDQRIIATLFTIKQFVAWIKDCLKVAKSNLLQAVTKSAIHGYLHCIRCCLKNLTGGMTGNYLSIWREILTSILDNCYNLSDIVTPFVAHTSPEGYLPVELLIEDDNLQASPVSLSENESYKEIITPQVLASYCWRSMKEVFLILGSISQLSRYSMEHQLRLEISPEQAKKIGEFLKAQLCIVKHVGVFELCYNGFVSYCDMLWSCRSFKLSPSLWIDELLKDLNTCNLSKDLCSTRRSAGLPFFIKAILTTEPASAQKRCFKLMMTELHEIAFKSDYSDDENTRDATVKLFICLTVGRIFARLRIHAFNIMRSIYRDTHFGDDVHVFVPDGVQAAIKGMAANNWQIRNAATLLFSALMNRIFGVKKDRDEQSKKNCMTGREFFSRYPKLYQLLLEHIQDATDKIDELPVHNPTLFPILLLLSKLYPSTMDGTANVMNLSKFLPFIKKCAHSVILRCRLLAAKAIAPLIETSRITQNIEELLEKLPMNKLNHLSQNFMHGVLLQIESLLASYIRAHPMGNNFKEDLLDVFSLKATQRLWICTRENKCPVTRRLFLRLLHRYYIKTNRLDKGIKLSLYEMLAEDVGISLPSYTPGLPLLLNEMVETLVLIIMMDSQEYSDSQKQCSLLRQLVFSPSDDVRYQSFRTLNYWISKSIKEESDIDNTVVPFINNCDSITEITSILYSIPFNDDFPDKYLAEVYEIFRNLLEIYRIKKFNQRCVLISSEMWHRSIQILTDKSKQITLRSNVLQFTHCVFADVLQLATKDKQRIDLRKEYFHIICQYALDMDTDLRLVALEILIHHSDIILFDNCKDDWSNIIRIVVCLAMESDDYSYGVAKLLAKLSGHNGTQQIILETTAGLEKLINVLTELDWYHCFITIIDLLLTDAPKPSKAALKNEDGDADTGRQVIFFQDDEMKRPAYEIEVLTLLAYQLCTVCWYGRDQVKIKNVSLRTTSDKKSLEQTSEADMIISKYLYQAFASFETACTLYKDSSQEFDFSTYTEVNLFNKVFRCGITILALTSTRNWKYDEKYFVKGINTNIDNFDDNSCIMDQLSLKENCHDTSIPLNYQFEKLQLIINSLDKTTLFHYPLIQPIFDRVNYICNNYNRK